MIRITYDTPLAGLSIGILNIKESQIRMEIFEFIVRAAVNVTNVNYRPFYGRFEAW